MFKENPSSANLVVTDEVIATAIANDNKVTWSKYAYQAVAMTALIASAGMANAGLGGGLDTATNSVTEIRDKAFLLVGVGAGAYLLWQAVLCWNGKKDWSDMIPAMIHVAIAGGSITLATWLWTTLA